MPPRALRMSSAPTFLVLAFSALALLQLAGCAASRATLSDARRVLASRTPPPEEWGREPLVVVSDTVRMRLLPGTKRNRIELVQTTWYTLGRSVELPAVWDHESVEKPAKVSVQVWGQDGKPIPYGLTRRFRPAPGDPLFLDLGALVTVIATPPAARQGALARVVVRREIFRPENWARLSIRREEPVQGRLVSLAYPADLRIRAGLRDPEGVGARESRRLAGKDSIIEVVVPPAAARASRRPEAPQDWEAALMMSMPARGAEPASWRTLGAGYAERWRRAIAENSAKTAFRTPEPWVRILDSVGRVREPDVAFELVRDRIRYLADEKGENGLMPRRPRQILQQGYGDCKEMATLLWSVLRERGFAAEIALAGTRGSWGALEEWPTLGAFNHMILALPDSAGGVRWYDPTAKDGSARRSAGHLAGLPVLRINESGGILDTIPDSLGLVRIHGRHRFETRDGMLWQVGSVGIQGFAASQISAAMSQAPPGLGLPRLRTLLLDHLGLQVIGARVLSQGPDSIEIGYEQPAEAMSEEQGGPLVSAPWPWFEDPAILPRAGAAPVRVAPLDQVDEWTLGAFAPPPTRDSAWADGGVRWTASRGRLSRRVWIAPARLTRDAWEQGQVAIRRKAGAAGKGAKP